MSLRRARNQANSPACRPLRTFLCVFPFVSSGLNTVTWWMYDQVLNIEIWVILYFTTGSVLSRNPLLSDVQLLKRFFYLSEMALPLRSSNSNMATLLLSASLWRFGEKPWAVYITLLVKIKTLKRTYSLNESRVSNRFSYFFLKSFFKNHLMGGGQVRNWTDTIFLRRNGFHLQMFGQHASVF